MMEQERNDWVIWAQGIWQTKSHKEAYAALRAEPFRASRTVARVIAHRSYLALPLWARKGLKKQARQARAAARQ